MEKTIEMQLLIASIYSDVRPVLNYPKVYAPIYKVYINPGSFIMLNQKERSIFRIIKTSNSEIELLDSGNIEKKLVSNILVNKFIFKEDISSLSTTVTILRNNHLSIIQEVVQTMNTYWVKNINITSICFVFYVDNILDHTYQILGPGNSYITRYYRNTENVITEIEPQDFESFYVDNNANLFSSDYSFETYIGLSQLRIKIMKCMCSSSSQGTSFISQKGLLFAISPSTWTYLMHYFMTNNIRINHYSRKRRICQLDFNMTYEAFTPPSINWMHVRFETSQELYLLQQLLGEHIIHGVEKKRPNKAQNYRSILNLNDKCNVVRAVPESERVDFSTRKPTNCGIDILYNNITGMKVWTRYESFVAKDHPEMKIHLNASTAIRHQISNLVSEFTVSGIKIHFGRTLFTYDSTLFKVLEEEENGKVVCEVLSSKSTEYKVRDHYSFDDVDTVKEIILENMTKE